MGAGRRGIIAIRDLLVIGTTATMTHRIHPTALVEENVVLGDRHERLGQRISATVRGWAQQCVVGGKSYIAYDVVIGNRVKVNSMAYICNAVTIEDGVMISAGVIFTNDRFPQGPPPGDLRQLLSSRPRAPNTRFPHWSAKEPRSAREPIIGCGNLTVGQLHAMVGMGSVVTRSIKDFHLVVGNPARSIGCVCRCGEPLLKWSGEPSEISRRVSCMRCNRTFEICGHVVHETLGAKGRAGFRLGFPGSGMKRTPWQPTVRILALSAAVF